jgi:dienelactone hydrolase
MFPVIYYLHGFDTKGTAYLDWVNWRLDEALDTMIASGESREMIVVMPECFGTGLVVNWGRPPPPKAPPLLTFPFRLLRGAFRSLDDPTYFGTFLYIHRWDLTQADYADFLTGEFLQHIEKTYRVAPGKNFRAICGFSTGGFSALSIALRNPGLFDSVSAHAPMLVSGSPFSADAGEMFVEFDPEIEGFIPQRFTISILRRIFVDEKTWRANNPIDLAREQRSGGMSVYIDVAKGDKRRYDAGAKELVSALRENGAKVRFNAVEDLPPASSHTYPGFLNGEIIARHAKDKSEKELRKIYGWKNLRELINPDVQRIKHSLTFHSQEFANERFKNSSSATAY